MKDQRKIDVEARDFQVNTKQISTNGQREDKECETRRQVVEKFIIQKPQGVKRFMKLVWKIHEGKGPLSRN